MINLRFENIRGKTNNTCIFNVRIIKKCIDYSFKLFLNNTAHCVSIARHCPVLTHTRSVLPSPRCFDTWDRTPPDVFQTFTHYCGRMTFVSGVFLLRLHLLSRIHCPSSFAALYMFPYLSSGASLWCLMPRDEESRRWRHAKRSYHDTIMMRHVAFRWRTRASESV